MAHAIGFQSGEIKVAPKECQLPGLANMTSAQNITKATETVTLKPQDLFTFARLIAARFNQQIGKVSRSKTPHQANSAY